MGEWESSILKDGAHGWVFQKDNLGVSKLNLQVQMLIVLPSDQNDEF
jgi:hypothetical protein